MDGTKNVEAWKLTSELLAAIGAHSTRTAGLRHVVRLLQARLPLIALSLVWADDAATFWELSATNSEGTLRQELRRKSSFSLREKSWMELESVLYLEDTDKVTIVAPLLEGKRSVGWSSIVLKPTGPAIWDVAFLEVWGQVLNLLFRHTTLLSRVATLSRKAHRENKQLRSELEQYIQQADWVTSSAVMQQALVQAEAVAQYDTLVLLRGESGTGKERLARWIHQRSQRSHRVFLQVNCGAWPESLLDSELFGHEKGAFTGADKLHLGCFERAKGGTLLLDEVAELPPSAQVKLLRVLQEGTFERVGGEEVLHADVRVIAATHQPLEKWVVEGRFRADLFYRLHVFPITIPPLRERRADIAALVADIVAEKAQKLGRAVPHLPQEVVQVLESHPWPGNVRELENTLERALILSPDDTLQLPRPLSWTSGSEVLPNTALLSDPGSSVATWEEATRRCIEEALYSSKGRIYGEGGAAELLGLKPSTLQSKMKKLGVSRDTYR